MSPSLLRTTTFSDLGLDGLDDLIWPKSEPVEALLAPIVIPSPRFSLGSGAGDSNVGSVRHTPHPLPPAPIGFAERRKSERRPSPPATTIHPPPHTEYAQPYHIPPKTPAHEHVDITDSTPLVEEADPFYAPPLNLKAASKGKKAKGKKKASPVVRVRADQPTFLTKLFQMLETPEYQLSIRWEPDERTIIILDPVTLESQILPMVYKMTKFASFSRQLNIYGFMRRESLRHVLGHQTDHPDASTWNHEYLHRKSTIADLLSYKRRVNPKETSEVAGAEIGRKRRRSTLPRMTPQAAARPRSARQSTISPASEISPGSVFDESPPDAYAALFKGLSPTKHSAPPMSAGVREAALALMGVSGGVGLSTASNAELDTYLGPAMTASTIPQNGLVGDSNAVTFDANIPKPYASFPWNSNPGSGSISPALLQPRPTTGGYPSQQTFASLLPHTAPMSTTCLPFVDPSSYDQTFDAFHSRPAVIVLSSDYLRAQPLDSMGSMAAQIASFGNLPPHLSWPPFNTNLNLAATSGQQSWGLGMSLDAASMPDLTLASSSATYGTSSAGNLSTTSLPFTSSPDEMFLPATDGFPFNAPSCGMHGSEQGMGPVAGPGSGEVGGVGPGAGIGVGVGISMGTNPLPTYSNPNVSLGQRTYGAEDAVAGCHTLTVNGLAEAKMDEAISPCSDSAGLFC